MEKITYTSFYTALVFMSTKTEELAAACNAFNTVFLKHKGPNMTSPTYITETSVSNAFRGLFIERVLFVGYRDDISLVACVMAACRELQTNITTHAKVFVCCVDDTNNPRYILLCGSTEYPVLHEKKALEYLSYITRGTLIAGHSHTEHALLHANIPRDSTKTNHWVDIPSEQERLDVFLIGSGSSTGQVNKHPASYTPSALLLTKDELRESFFQSLQEVLGHKRWNLNGDDQLYFSTRCICRIHDAVMVAHPCDDLAYCVTCYADLGKHNQLLLQCCPKCGESVTGFSHLDE